METTPRSNTVSDMYKVPVSSTSSKVVKATGKAQGEGSGVPWAKKLSMDLLDPTCLVTANGAYPGTQAMNMSDWYSDVSILEYRIVDGRYRDLDHGDGLHVLPMGAYYYDNGWTFGTAVTAWAVDFSSGSGPAVVSSGLFNTARGVNNGGNITDVSSQLRINLTQAKGNSTLIYSSLIGDSPEQSQDTSTVDIVFRILNRLATMSLLSNDYSCAQAGITIEIDNPIIHSSGIDVFPLCPGAVTPGINCRACSANQFIDILAGFTQTDVNWEVQHWGTSVAVVPVRQSFVDAGGVNAEWILAHLESPFRFAFTSAHLTNIDTAAHIRLTDHTTTNGLVRVPGPQTQVLLVFVDNYDGGAATLMQCRVGSGVVSVDVEYQANNVLGGADVDILPALSNVFVDSLTDSGNIVQALTRWAEMCGTKEDYLAAAAVVSDLYHVFPIAQKRYSVTSLDGLFEYSPGSGMGGGVAPTTALQVGRYQATVTTASGVVGTNLIYEEGVLQTTIRPGWTIRRHSVLIYMGMALRYFRPVNMISLPLQVRAEDLNARFREYNERMALASDFFFRMTGVPECVVHTPAAGALPHLIGTAKKVFSELDSKFEARFGKSVRWRWQPNFEGSTAYYELHTVEMAPIGRIWPRTMMKYSDVLNLAFEQEEVDLSLFEWKVVERGGYRDQLQISGPSEYLNKEKALAMMKVCSFSGMGSMAGVTLENVPRGIALYFSQPMRKSDYGRAQFISASPWKALNIGIIPLDSVAKFSTLPYSYAVDDAFVRVNPTYSAFRQVMLRPSLMLSRPIVSSGWTPSIYREDIDYSAICNLIVEDVSSFL
jgi:hypothetical protein